MTSTAPPGLLLVHAHPDDESLWTGGTIAYYAARGVRVTVVTCTLGEQGEVIPPELAELAADAADQLGGYRAGELRSACAALGVADHRFLGGIGRWRDSGMAGDPANEHSRAFVRGSVDEQASWLAGLIEEIRPQAVISYAADGGYGHPDHIRAHEITVAAAAGAREAPRVFYTVRSRPAVEAGLTALANVPGLPFRMPAPAELAAVEDDVITHEIDITAHQPAVRRAMRAHATQIAVWESGEACAYALSNGVAQPVLDVEHYTLAGATVAGTRTDLLGGLVPSAGDDRDRSW